MSKPTSLTREQILGAKRRQQQVDVPEWGGSVTITALTLADRGRALTDLIRSGSDHEGDPAAHKEAFRDWQIRLLIRSILDESGEPMFGADDLAALAKADGVPVTRIVDAAGALNGFFVQQKDPVEEVAKN